MTDENRTPNEVRVYLEMEQYAGEKWRFCGEFLVTEPLAIELLQTTSEPTGNVVPLLSPYVQTAYHRGIPSRLLVCSPSQMNTLAARYMGIQEERDDDIEASIDLEVIHAAMLAADRFDKRVRGVIFIHMDPPPQF